MVQHKSVADEKARAKERAQIIILPRQVWF